ncbi:MAG: hypothetical protein M0Q14_10715 [Tissierellaceae bacterium]|nr:hypothetical protein [Tissierellaceae bacterium]
MAGITAIIILAIQVEAVWETIKMIWENGKVNIDKVGALAIGLLIAVGADLQLNLYLDVHIVVPYLDTILTGILISRGSNYIHDLMSKLS